MPWLNVYNVSVHFTCKTGKKRLILYEKLCIKVYLDDEKTHVDQCPHNGHSVGNDRDHCASLGLYDLAHCITYTQWLWLR